MSHKPFAYAAFDRDMNVALLPNKPTLTNAWIPLYVHPPKPTGLDQLLERIRFLERQIAERKNREMQRGGVAGVDRMV